MALEQEIKDFMNGLGVEVVGLAGPGRFDGPPSLDPEYVLKGAKSIICFAIPHDVDAIYMHLSKKSAIPHNIDQIRKMQRTMHIGIKLQKFLKERGYRSGTVGANSHYRRDPDVFSTHARFSHRYAAYVTGIAAPGISGNAITKKYGATCVLYTVVTDAVLESDSMMDPRHFYDGRCQDCLACKGSCPPKMFESEKEEYALINGQLFPRGQKRDIDLCNVSCAGMHGLSSTKKWSTWGRTWLPHWVGKEPETEQEKKKIRPDLVSSFIKVSDWAPRLQVLFDSYSTPMEEGLFEDPKRFPDYEELPGETEGQKLRAYADVLERIFGFHVEDPLTQTCAQCFQVCGNSAEESLNRFKVLSTSGIVVYDKGNEPKVFQDYEEAAKLHAKKEYKVRTIVKIDDWLLMLKSMFTYLGVDFHTVKHKKKYYKKLKEAIIKNEKEQPKENIIEQKASA